MLIPHNPHSHISKRWQLPLTNKVIEATLNLQRIHFHKLKVLKSRKRL